MDLVLPHTTNLTIIGYQAPLRLMYSRSLDYVNIDV